MHVQKNKTWSGYRLNCFNFRQLKILYVTYANSKYHILFWSPCSNRSWWFVSLWQWTKVKYSIFRALVSGNAFYTIDFNVGLIIMNCVFGFAGIWLVFWIFYSNIFVIMSAAAIWYYQQDSPLCTSFGRLVRYHSGSISLTSFLFGFLFILRLISKFFYLRN